MIFLKLKTNKKTLIFFSYQFKNKNAQPIIINIKLKRKELSGNKNRAFLKSLINSSTMAGGALGRALLEMSEWTVVVPSCAPLPMSLLPPHDVQNNTGSGDPGLQITLNQGSTTYVLGPDLASWLFCVTH